MMDEHARVEEVLLHADAVAEHRPAGERARRVDGHDADAEPALPVEPIRPASG
jgi:hypothetical protein